MCTRLWIGLLGMWLLHPGMRAQSTIQPKPINYENQGLLYEKEFTVDLRLHTYGMALAVNKGTIETYYRTKYWQVELGEIRHSKEFRQRFEPAPGTESTNSFIFGKQNSFLLLRGGLGKLIYKSEHNRKRNIVVGYTWLVGPTLGILKPYYLYVRRAIPGDPQKIETVAIRYSDETANEFLDISRIRGSAGLSKGLNEISLIPGIHGKFGLHLARNTLDNYVMAVETGVMLDVFPKKVPIMVNTVNSPLFLNLYLNLHLGKRW